MSLIILNTAILSIILAVLWVFAPRLVLLITDAKIITVKRYPQLYERFLQLEWGEQIRRIEIFRTDQQRVHSIHVLGSNRNKKVVIHERAESFFSKNELESFLVAFLENSKIVGLSLFTFLLFMRLVFFHFLRVCFVWVNRLISNEQVSLGVVLVLFWTLSPYHLMLQYLSDRMDERIMQQIKSEAREDVFLQSFFEKYTSIPRDPLVNTLKTLLSKPEAFEKKKTVNLV
jgi:ABC-type multidrug transport system fused ATPase/permease subunit